MTTTIAQQAKELADMASRLHRQHITKDSVADAIKSTTLPAAVANTEPREILEDVNSEHNELPVEKFGSGHRPWEDDALGSSLNPSRLAAQKTHKEAYTELNAAMAAHKLNPTPQAEARLHNAEAAYSKARRAALYEKDDKAQRERHQGRRS